MWGKAEQRSLCVARTRFCVNRPWRRHEHEADCWVRKTMPSVQSSVVLLRTQTVPIKETGAALPHITNSWIRVSRRAAGKPSISVKDSEEPKVDNTSHFGFRSITLDTQYFSRVSPSTYHIPILQKGPGCGTRRFQPPKPGRFHSAVEHDIRSGLNTVHSLPRRMGAKPNLWHA